MPRMPTRRERYDAALIGSSQAGVQLAVELARAGLRTVLIKCFSDPGACIESGDAPSIPLLVSANIARLARSAGDFGVHTGNVEVDLCKVQRLRRQAIVEGLRSQSIQPPQDTPHLTMLTGEPRFEAAGLLRVRESDGADIELQAPCVVINTGARTALPDLPGLNSVPYLTASSALELEELPSHLLVLGGSYLGVEFAQMFRRFGSRVSIIERRSQLLAGEDRDIAAAVAESLREDGVEVFLETEAIGMVNVNEPDAGVQLKVRTPSGAHALAGSRLLVVAGREPNTQGLNLRAAGVALDSRGYVEVNEHLETSATGVYALGVVNGGPPFAQVAYDDLRVIRANVLENRPGAKASRTGPFTAFTNPPLGRIGLTHAQARAQGRKLRLAKLPLSKVESGVTFAESRGLIKLLIEADTDRILGAAVLGVHSAEIIGMLQIAMMAAMPCTALRDGLSAYPTLAGSLNNLFVALEACKPFKKENVNEPAEVFSDRHQGAT
jgi:pyruvate/2-oxoglutarate dehydrogenase complex dihydrolipoamide dehydrogenase (E3) component